MRNCFYCDAGKRDGSSPADGDGGDAAAVAICHRGVLLLYGAVNLFLSRLEIYSDRVVGTPFSYLTRKTVTIPCQQIQRMETDPKSGMLVLYTASGKHSFACKDLQKAYEVLQG